MTKFTHLGDWKSWLKMFRLREQVGVGEFGTIFVAQKPMPSGFEYDFSKNRIRAIPKSFACYAFEAMYKNYFLTS